MIIQVKITIAQLIALRISRGRPPEKLFERIVNGLFDFRWFENKRYCSDITMLYIEGEWFESCDVRWGIACMWPKRSN